MENEVIIDGCNVAECYFYYKGECRCELNCIDLYKNKTITELATRTPEHNYMECKPSNNCYFKQLQRAKAKNERLKEIKESLKEIKQLAQKNACDGIDCDTCLNECNHRLNDALKEIIKEIDEVINER